ncbi:MAG TPA: aminotransferase class I/II-fold pyridoxal phosphate-dependent enzyme [Gemmatimonadaceae bacterium]|nr:aminotransferase class I/II-fold pyridoxal phosphate-dependent enzyme [Gemmatimonadaceae bacterium]
MSARSPLDLDHDTMRRLGRRVADLVADHLASLRDQPVLTGTGRHEAVQMVGLSPPANGAEFEELLETLRTKVFAYHAREPHPGFIAYVPSCPTFPAVLGDWLATGFNFFAGVWYVASGPNALELVVLDWFREWLGMPLGAGGLLTSGGSTATLMAVVAARHAAIGDDPALLARLVVYTSDQAHSSVDRAAWIAGVARANVRALPSDEAFRLTTASLTAAMEEDRAAGRIPFMVVASAGTTNTGAVDPLDDIATLCERERVWFHIDAAYGGFAAISERGRALFGGLSGFRRADSVTVDAHKWLFVPFECGGLLVREPRRLKDAFQIYPDYLKDGETQGDEVNFADYGEQLTRYSRALKVWLSVSYFGVDAIRAGIDGGMNVAAAAEQFVRAAPELEVLSPAQFGIFCFRAIRRGASDDELDTLNQRINAAINAEGRFFISSTRLHGVFALRICILGYRTTEADVRELVNRVIELARELAQN